MSVIVNYYKWVNYLYKSEVYWLIVSEVFLCIPPPTTLTLWTGLGRVLVFWPKTGEGLRSSRRSSVGVGSRKETPYGGTFFTCRGFSTVNHKLLISHDPKFWVGEYGWVLWKCSGRVEVSRGTLGNDPTVVSSWRRRRDEGGGGEVSANKVLVRD